MARHSGAFVPIEPCDAEIKKAGHGIGDLQKERTQSKIMGGIIAFGGQRGPYRGCVVDCEDNFVTECNQNNYIYS